MQLEKTAERYVKKVSINPEMSHNKILSRIRKGSQVLEFGPASGAMTEVLEKEYECHVCIVEIDKDCFKKAMQYAEDGICTDIEQMEWLDRFGDRKFDYIILADVLEHLREPGLVLEKVKSILASDGSVLISVPNIAHNSVIIQLLKNHFIYQNTGILDHTHVKHFTYNEIGKLCTDSGYGIIYMDGVYIGVGRNEFDISYSDIDPMLAEMLKKRPFGEVYQHILEIKQKEYIEENHIKIENCLGTSMDHAGLFCTEEVMHTDSNKKENERILDILQSNPNYYFADNYEISRLRLEINELYLSQPELENTKQLRERIYECQEEIKIKNRHIFKLDREIEEKEVVIQSLEVEKREVIQSLEMEKREMLQSCQKKIQELELQLEMHKKKSEELEEKVNGLEAEAEVLKEKIRNQEGHIELLLESERAFEREQNTRSYRLAKKIQKTGQWFVPINSKRRFFARILYQMLRHPRLMLHVLSPKRVSQYIWYLKKEGMEGVNKRYDDIMSMERMKASSDKNGLLDLSGADIVADEATRSIDEYEKIIFESFEEPVVSIVIPVYNEFAYTYNCLKAIRRNTKDIAYEVIIADDCSTDLTVKIEQVAENIRLVTTEKNVRFLLNCNHAAQYAKGKYILFLNNDTQVQPGWISPLVTILEHDERAGMVGSKLVYADGRLQEAGGILWSDGSAWNYGNRQPTDSSEFNYVKEADYISGAAIMIRASLWKEIGGFDERFVPAYCEDSDLAFEVRKHGYKVIYQPLSVVVHFEGVSNGTDTGTGQKAYQVVNQKKFLEKWEDVLQKQHFPNAEKVFLARDRSREKPVLLMIDHYVPQYDKDAGSRTVYQYLKLFVEKGYNVKFIGDNFFRHEPYTTKLQQMGIEVLYGPYYAGHWQEWIEENAEFIQFVFLNRPHISVKYIDFIRRKTNARIIYYGHDLHFLREIRNYELTGDKKALSDSHKWKEKEIKLMHKADVVYYPSEIEVQEIKKIDSQIPAKAIVAYMFQNVVVETYHMECRKDIMFIGGFVHTPNIDAVLWFAMEIMPILKEKIPDIKFYILGSHPTVEIQKLSDDHIIVKGFVTDEELEHYYKTCRISVVPLRYGAGIKGKVVEAMRYGMPVVTTSVGAEGITGAEDILCIADEAGELGEKICALYNNKDKLTEMSKASYEYIRKNFSEENAWKVIAEDFKKTED